MGGGEGLAWWGANRGRREDKPGRGQTWGVGARGLGSFTCIPKAGSFRQGKDLIRTQAGSLGVRVDWRCRDKRGGGPSAQDVQVSCSERPQARASRGGHTDRIPEGGGR